MYIGKTSRIIGSRLREHAKKIRGRVAFERIGCKFAYVEDPSLVDVAEGTLINFFEGYAFADWNRSGFGSKVAGYNRGRQVGSDWEELFPPDLNWPIAGGAVTPITLFALLKQVARSSPITLSLPRGHRPAFNLAHPDRLSISVAERAFSDWIVFIEEHLTPEWTIDRQDSAWYIEPRQ